MFSLGKMTPQDRVSLKLVHSFDWQMRRVPMPRVPRYKSLHSLSIDRVLQQDSYQKVSHIRSGESYLLAPSRRSKSGDDHYCLCCLLLIYNAIWEHRHCCFTHSHDALRPLNDKKMKKNKYLCQKNAFLIKSTHKKSWSCDETDQCKSGGKTSRCCVQTLRCSLRRHLINLTDVWAVAHLIRFACAVFSHCKLHLQPCCHFLLHRTSKKRSTSC